MGQKDVIIQFLQVQKLLDRASVSPENPAHFVFVGILGVAMETDPAPSPYWFRPALLLLEYVRESIAELAKVCVCASFSTLTHSLQDSPPPNPSPTPSLPDLLRPLVKKNVKTSLAHSMLLLWLLDIMVTHVPTVEVSTGVCMHQSHNLYIYTCSHVNHVTIT